MFAQDSEAWIQYAEFEAALEEMERAKAIFEFAISGGRNDDSSASPLVALD